MNPSQFPPFSTSTQNQDLNGANPSPRRNIYLRAQQTLLFPSFPSPSSSALPSFSSSSSSSIPRNIVLTAQRAELAAQQTPVFPRTFSASSSSSSSSIPPAIQTQADALAFLAQPRAYQQIELFNQALELAYPPSPSQAASSTSSASAANPIDLNKAPEDLSQFISQTERQIEYIDLFISNVKSNKMYIGNINSDFGSKIDILNTISSNINLKTKSALSFSENRTLNNLLSRTSKMTYWLKGKWNEFRLKNVNHIDFPSSSSSARQISLGRREASAVSTTNLASKRARTEANTSNNPPVDLTEDQRIISPSASSSSSSSSTARILMPPPPPRRARTAAQETGASSSSIPVVDLTKEKASSSSSTQESSKNKRRPQDTVAQIIDQARHEGLDWFVDEIKTRQNEIVAKDNHRSILNLLFLYTDLKNEGKSPFK